MKLNIVVESSRVRTKQRGKLVGKFPSFLFYVKWANIIQGSLCAVCRTRAVCL